MLPVVELVQSRCHLVFGIVALLLVNGHGQIQVKSDDVDRSLLALGENQVVRRVLGLLLHSCYHHDSCVSVPAMLVPDRQIV